MNALRLFFLATLLAGCGATRGVLPEGEGRGLLQVSGEPAAGEPIWLRPEWSVGDHFTLVRGERMRGTFRVIAVEDGQYHIDMGNGQLLKRDLDLGNLGQWNEGSGDALRVMSPVDMRYHWPLWVGKQWQCEFVDCVRGGQALAMTASYVVEGMDTIRVPAGEYESLRIRRTLRLSDAGDDFLTRTQMTWFAPDPGVEVRQLIGDTLVELVSFQRDD